MCLLIKELKRRNTFYLDPASPDERLPSSSRDIIYKIWFHTMSWDHKYWFILYSLAQSIIAFCIFIEPCGLALCIITNLSHKLSVEGTCRHHLLQLCSQNQALLYLNKHWKHRPDNLTSTLSKTMEQDRGTHPLVTLLRHMCSKAVTDGQQGQLGTTHAWLVWWPSVRG